MKCTNWLKIAHINVFNQSLFNQLFLHSLHTYPLEAHTTCLCNYLYFITRRSVSVNWVACGTCYTKTEGTELGGIEGVETGFSQESGWLGQSENNKDKSPGIQQVLLVNSHNGRSRPGVQAQMQHISHHPQGCSVQKRNTI